ALDWLRERLATVFEERGKGWLKVPWEARNAYIDLILDRGESNVTAFLERHAVPGLGEREQVSILALLEMQRHAMLMYTSCGWFFDELSGIETVQVPSMRGGRSSWPRTTSG